MKRIPKHLSIRENTDTDYVSIKGNCLYQITMNDFPHANGCVLKTDDDEDELIVEFYGINGGAYSIEQTQQILDLIKTTLEIAKGEKFIQKLCSDTW